MKTNLVGGLQSKRVLQVTELTYGTSCNSTHLTVINLFFLKKKRTVVQKVVHFPFSSIKVVLNPCLLTEAF